jgi:hypothetical protein
MQVLDVASSVGSALPVPMTACMASAMGKVDLASCSVIVYDQNDTRISSEAAFSLSFKAAVDPTCTPARVYSGLCSACTASAATAGMCPLGTHTFIFDIGVPGHLWNGTVLAMAFHVGSSLLSAKVLIQFAVISDSGSLAGEVSNASEALQAMLVSSKVRFYKSLKFHATIALVLSLSLPPLLFYPVVYSEQSWQSSTDPLNISQLAFAPT